MICQSSRHLLYPSLLLVLATVFSACAEPDTTGANEFVVADVFATPGKSLATAELSPTPQLTTASENLLSNTPAPTLPLPTVVVLEQPTLPILITGPTPTTAVAISQPTTTPMAACASTPPLPFGAIWQNIPQVQAAMRCPTGEPQDIPGVWQMFERGVMFWRENDHSIFIISELAIRQGQATDKWWRIEDTWQADEPEDDPSLQPPNGMRQPIRGFGKVWRGNGFIREAVGWAAADEIQINSQWQTFEGGWMMTGPNNTPVYVMVPLDEMPYTNGTHLGPQ
ncbi:MAG: hypothetical protein JXB07_03395 [Anaerolineae bacterium]|nr:hypothetical protein [Anaerolineae bacterium]